MVMWVRFVRLPSYPLKKLFTWKEGEYKWWQKKQKKNCMGKAQYFNLYRLITAE